MLPSQLRAVNATLSNDENSTDAEMIQYFVYEIGISHKEAIDAIKRRGQIFMDVSAVSNA